MPADEAGIFAEIAAMIRDTAGPFGAGLTITRDSDLRDLGLESLDVVALAGRIQERYGWAVNLAEFVAGLDATRATEVTVGRLVDFVGGQLAGSRP